MTERNRDLFDSKNLKDLPPPFQFLQQEENESDSFLISFPSFRLPYVADCLRYHHLTYHVRDGVCFGFIDHNIYDTGSLKSSDDIKEKFLQELRAFSLRQFDYECWHSSISCASVRSFNCSTTTTNRDNSIYPPLLAPSPIIIPLLSLEVSLLHDVIKTRLWYCKKLKEEENQRLEEMARRINPFVRRACQEGEGKKCFFRLSTHSPKDVPPRPRSEKGAPPLPKCCAEKAMDIIDVLQRSERVLTDLYTTTRLPSLENRPVCLILCPWKDLSGGFEFRCFLFGGTLRAISQVLIFFFFLFLSLSFPSFSSFS
mmetsp:Transcript_42363/g.59338  ORF Transcript_42363/g.59338 Transcript_42363/m.59338 type:complete len:313 (-) Transcript_42363:216-1154(-)